MTSQIDPTKPTPGVALTAEVRANFAAAKKEIELLQWMSGSLPLGGVTKIDRSGAVILGGEAQELMPANPDRRGWSIQNKSTAAMYFNDLGNAADPASVSAVYLSPGAYYESEPGGASIAAISIYGDATGSQFGAREW